MPNFPDEINPLWPPAILRFRTGLIGAKTPYHPLLIDVFWQFYLDSISAGQAGGVPVEPLLAELGAPSSTVQNTGLVAHMPILAFMGGQQLDYDFTDPTVFNPATGTHYLGDTFPGETKILYIVKPYIAPTED